MNTTILKGLFIGTVLLFSSCDEANVNDVANPDTDIGTYVTTDVISQTDTQTLTQSNTSSETQTQSITQTEVETDSQTNTQSETITDTHSNTETEIENLAPIISAGEDKIAYEDEVVYLTGEAMDSDSFQLTHLWTQAFGPEVIIENPDSQFAQFTVGEISAATLIGINYQVVDEYLNTSTDQIIIRVGPVNDAPTATISVPVDNFEEDNIILSSEVSDVDSSSFTHLWTQVSGTPANILNSRNAQMTFVVDELAEQETLLFSYTVTDSQEASYQQDVYVIVQPFNDAPTHQLNMVSSEIFEQTNHQIDAIVVDVDSENFTHLWQQVSGTTALLTNADTQNLTIYFETLTIPETFTFSYQVTDDQGASSQSEISFDYNPTNIAPVANAGVDQTIIHNADFPVLRGSATDEDSEIVTTMWTQIAGTPIEINSPENLVITIPIYDYLGTEEIIFELTVTDDFGSSHSDQVSFFMQVINDPPHVNAGKDKYVHSEQDVKLIGDYIDPDYGNTAFNWAQTNELDNLIALQIESDYAVSFTAPEVVSQTDFYFSYSVTTDENIIFSDQMVVSVYPQGADIYFERQTLSDTGSISCFKDLDCDDANTVKQDAHFGRDADLNLIKEGSGFAGFDFTKLDEDGLALPVDASQHTCVLDNHTNLMWEVKTDDHGLHHYESTYFYFEPNSELNDGVIGHELTGQTCENYTGGVVVTQCNTQVFLYEINQSNYCGFNDWRIPTYEEMMSIVIMGEGTRLDEEFFPYTLTRKNHRTSTITAPAFNNSIRAVYFYELPSSFTNTKVGPLPLILVRENN
ncbi:PKD domain-containing protein [Marinicellulosiphila megalodicopiae]|uniref:PKD domain-containing protein n=1 Tax=Marinicellulosiphila megalodicopiae TaxID=2724896 RepID=UPI003BB21718